MADKTFNEQPMLVVVSDALDPRSKRQLQSQLQSVVMTNTEIATELENLKAAEEMKAQKESVKDQTEFDDQKTKDTPPPAPVENNNDDNSAQQQAAPAPQNSGAENEPVDGDSAADDTPVRTQVQTDDQTNNTTATPQQDGQQADDGQAPTQAPAAQAQPDSNSGGSTPDAAGNNSNTAQNGDGEDPFNDDNINFEAFAGILGFDYKTESAGQTEESELPPIKNVLMIKASDRGVDTRTSAVVATIEDPQNTVVVIDQSELVETEAKMQFRALTKQLQTRGIMVTDSIDQTVEYLNNIYDELAGA